MKYKKKAMKAPMSGVRVLALGFIILIIIGGIILSLPE